MYPNEVHLQQCHLCMNQWMCFLPRQLLLVAVLQAKSLETRYCYLCREMKRELDTVSHQGDVCRWREILPSYHLEEGRESA